MDARSQPRATVAGQTNTHGTHSHRREQRRSESVSPWAVLEVPWVVRKDRGRLSLAVLLTSSTQRGSYTKALEPRMRCNIFTACVREQHAVRPDASRLVELRPRLPEPPRELSADAAAGGEHAPERPPPVRRSIRTAPPPATFHPWSLLPSAAVDAGALNPRRGKSVSSSRPPTSLAQELRPSAGIAKVAVSIKNVVQPNQMWMNRSTHRKDYHSCRHPCPSDHSVETNGQHQNDAPDANYY